jgi:hypothetical protein
MSGETERAPSGWTVDTLGAHLQRQHNDLITRLDERHVADDRAVQSALASAKEAVIKAEVASEKRFEAVNEFRSTLADQATRLLPRAEADARFKAIEDKVGIGASLDSTAQGQRDARAGLRLDASTVTAAIALVIAAYVAFGR